MDRRAVITLDGDTLKIDLPNAVVQISLPTRIPVFGADSFPRFVDLDVKRGRFAIPDEDYRTFVTYEEKYQRALGGLLNASEISETSRNLSKALENDYGPPVTERTDTPPTRGRSPTSRATNSRRVTEVEECSQRAKSQSPLFTPGNSPQSIFNEQKANELLTREPHRRASGPPEVPLGNIGLKAMTASDRYKHNPAYRNATPPSKGRSHSNTPGSQPMDRSVRDIGTITPQKMSWKRRCTSDASTRRSVSSNSATPTGQSLARFQQPWRIPGTQPLVTRHSGMAYYTPPSITNTTNADDAATDEEIPTTNSYRESSPTPRNSKRRKSEGATVQASFVIDKGGTQKADQLKSRKEVTPSPKLSGKSKETEAQGSSVMAKGIAQPYDQLKTREKITPPKPKDYSKAKAQAHVQDHQADRRKCEGIEVQTSLITTKDPNGNADKSTNRKGLTHPLPPKPALKGPEKPRSDPQDHLPQRPKSASSKQTNASPTKPAQAYLPDHRSERSISTGTTKFSGKNRPAPPPSPMTTSPYPIKGNQYKAPQVQGASPSKQHPQAHSQDRHHHPKAGSDRPSAEKGRKRPAPCSPSPTKEHHPKAVPNSTTNPARKTQQQHP
ncbi:MAG: hypothetical protein Q9196_005739, partial [Gyalolechia fulgens]